MEEEYTPSHMHKQLHKQCRFKRSWIPGEEGNKYIYGGIMRIIKSRQTYIVLSPIYGQFELDPKRVEILDSNNE